MDWSNELTMEFLGAYKKESVIWNPKNKSHSNRNLINDAWTRIQQGLSAPYVIAAFKKKKNL